MKLYYLIVPLGILTYLLVASTAASGLLKMNIKWHKALAITAVVLATLHAGIIIYLKLSR